MTHPLPFVWPYAAAFWIAYLWAFAPEFGFMRRTKGATSTDSGSLRFILFGMQLAMFVAFFVSFIVKPFASNRIPLFWAGILLMILGSAIRRHCFRVLGEYFTYAVIVSKEQKVIDRGAYRWVRHPSYSGGTLMFAGMGLGLGNWLSLTLLLVMTIAAYGYRVMVEERALVETIGDPYREYMKRSKRFIPFVI